MKYDESNILAQKVRKRGPSYAGITSSRVHCIKFKSLLDVREVWIDVYYDDDDLPDGWDDDLEDDVDGIDASQRGASWI